MICPIRAPYMTNCTVKQYQGRKTKQNEKEKCQKLPRRGRVGRRGPKRNTRGRDGRKRRAKPGGGRNNSSSRRHRRPVNARRGPIPAISVDAHCPRSPHDFRNGKDDKSPPGGYRSNSTKGPKADGVGGVRDTLGAGGSNSARLARVHRAPVINPYKTTAAVINRLFMMPYAHAKDDDDDAYLIYVRHKCI